MHKDKIYVPISNFDGYDKKDFQRAALERGYNVSVNGPNFIIDLSNPAFSLNESIVTNKEISKNHNLFIEKNINDEHGQNSEDFKEFIMFCCNNADIDLPTKIYLRGTRDKKLRTTASYNPNNHDIHIYCKGRHMVDVMRSVAHELMHMKQMLDNRLYDNSGDDGSNEENEAHSFSGLMIRKFGRERPKIYEGYSKDKNLI